MSNMVRMLLDEDDLTLVNDALAKVARLALGEVTPLVEAWQGRLRLDKAVNAFPEGMMREARFAASAVAASAPRAWPDDGAFDFGAGRGMLTALELWFRPAGMGQFGGLGFVWRDFDWAAARQFSQMFAGALPGQSFGIMSPEVPDGYRRLCEIHEALRHRIYWTFDPPKKGRSYLTFYQPAHPMTGKPLPVAEVVAVAEVCDICDRPLGHCHGMHP